MVGLAVFLFFFLVCLFVGFLSFFCVCGICFGFFYLFFNRIRYMSILELLSTSNHLLRSLLILNGGLLHCELHDIIYWIVILSLSTKTEGRFSRKLLYSSKYNPHTYCCPEKHSCLSIRLFESGRKMHDSESWLYTPHCLNNWTMNYSSHILWQF